MTVCSLPRRNRTRHETDSTGGCDDGQATQRRSAGMLAACLAACLFAGGCGAIPCAAPLGFASAQSDLSEAVAHDPFPDASEVGLQR